MNVTRITCFNEWQKMLQGSAEEAHKYGESTFMIYTGAPQNTRRKNIEDLNIEKGQQAMKTYGLSNIVVHAPYIINIANTTKPEVFNLGVDFLQKKSKELKHLEQKILYYILGRMSEQV